MQTVQALVPTPTTKQLNIGMEGVRAQINSIVKDQHCAMDMSTKIAETTFEMWFLTLHDTLRIKLQDNKILNLKMR